MFSGHRALHNIEVMQFRVFTGQSVMPFMKSIQNIEEMYTTENTHHRRYSGHFGSSGLANSMEFIEAMLVLKSMLVMQVFQDIQETRWYMDYTGYAGSRKYSVHRMSLWKP